MRTRLSLPLPLFVLALVAALALGTVGSASAGTLTTKTVKKIAAKVVDKKASSLSVAHAATADTATNASNAANATNATNAGNSTQLDGKAATTYLDRVAHANLTASLGITDNTVTQIVNPTGIVVPAGVGFIHVTAHAMFSGGSANLRMWPSLDGTCVQNSGDDYDHGGVSNTTNQTTISLDYLTAVTPGSHNVRLCVITGGPGVFTTVRSLTIQTIANDFNG